MARIATGIATTAALATLVALVAPSSVNAEGPRVHTRVENGIRIVELPDYDEPESDTVRDDDAGSTDDDLADASLRPTIVARAGLAFGGEASAEILGTRLRSDMHTSLWLGAEFSYPLLPYVTLGGEVRSIWWQTDGDDDSGVGHHWLLDVDPFVKAAYPIRAGSSWGRVYARVPVGLTLSRLNSDIDSVNRVSTSAGLGWNLGVYAGVEWFFGRLGIGGELGYLYHAISNPVEGGGRHADLDTTFGQFGFQLHVAMAL